MEVTTKDNIFSNVKFGDMFKTRDERNAVVVDVRTEFVDIFIERGEHQIWGEWKYSIRRNGSTGMDNFSQLDIVEKVKL